MSYKLVERERIACFDGYRCTAFYTGAQLR